MPPDSIRETMQSFSESFRSPVAVRQYEEEVYRPGHYDDTIWSYQRTYLEGWLRRFREGHAYVKGLDFACGTGRVTSLVEGYVDEMVGLDISPEMLQVAKERTTRTDLRQGDILSNPDVVDRDYDLITAFRFFLNAEPELRASIIRTLSARLRDDRSRLVFNVHGNRRSVRHLSLQVHARRGQYYHEMSLSEVHALTEAAGLEIESWRGFGIMPRILYRTRVGPVVRRIDRVALRADWLSSIGCDLLFVCRKKSRTS